MRQQNPRFPESPAESRDIAFGIRGSAPTLSRTQKQFNKLVEEIALLRLRLAAWHEFASTYHRLFEEKLQPLQQALREGQVALAGILDDALLGKHLTRRERVAALDFLASLLEELIDDEAPDEALIALAARHDIDLASDEEFEVLERMRVFGEEIFGVDVGPHHGATTPEELARRLADEVAAAEAAHAAKRKARPKSAKVKQREAQAEQLAEDASKAIREIFRKLASELHPDRIADEDERARKSELMQQANIAYAAGDLLSLLQLQWKIEQIDPARLANLAEEKLAHFNHVLKDQAKCLRERIEVHAAPFFAHFDYVPPRDLQPVHVERAMSAHTADLRKMVSALQRDVQRYANLAELKADLRSY
jgi:hypothetical protein